MIKYLNDGELNVIKKNLKLLTYYKKFYYYGEHENLNKLFDMQIKTLDKENDQTIKHKIVELNEINNINYLKLHEDNETKEFINIIDKIFKIQEKYDRKTEIWITVEKKCKEVIELLTDIPKLIFKNKVSIYSRVMYDIVYGKDLLTTKENKIYEYVREEVSTYYRTAQEDEDIFEEESGEAGVVIYDEENDVPDEEMFYNEYTGYCNVLAFEFNHDIFDIDLNLINDTLFEYSENRLDSVFFIYHAMPNILFFKLHDEQILNLNSLFFYSFIKLLIAIKGGDYNI